jgi:TonB family protein
MTPPTPKPKLPNFLVPEESWAAGFFSRLHSYLTERPGPLPKTRGNEKYFREHAYGSSFAENLKEFFSSVPAAARQPVHGRMLDEQRSGMQIFWENLRDFVAPRKLPPLKLTSKPVKVKEIWSKDPQARPAQLVSFAAHALIVSLLLVPVVNELTVGTVKAERINLGAVDIAPFIPKQAAAKKAQGGGGGGDRDPRPASQGKAPRFAMTAQLTPPQVIIKNPNAALQVEPTLYGPPELKLPPSSLPNWGDPRAAGYSGSGGPGSGGGIGDGSGGGVGSGEGGGYGSGSGGGTGGGVFNAGTGGVSYATCQYCPRPEYSEEGYKAKYQGIVLLRVLITPEGRASNITVVKGPGLGLDEKAIEAVRTWRFRPSIGANGKPVAAWNTVEVSYRLH